MKIMQEFKEFAMRGNVLDLAVGVIIGTAFGKIVTSIVEDIIMPPIGFLMKGVNFADLFWTLDGAHYASVAEAKEKGAPVIAYGQFVNVFLNFLIVAFCVFLLVKGINKLKRKKPEAPKAPTEKDCPYCLQKVPVLATRCSHCTSHLQAAEGQTQ